MDAITAMQRRISVRRFRPDPVPRATIEALLDAAVRAPNHKLTEPWRFAVLTDAARDRFAELRARQRRTRFPDPESDEARSATDKIREETEQTPALIVVMCAVSPDPKTREEDYAAAMMAIQNLCLAATASGLGTHVKTGAVMADPGARAAAGVKDGERIIAIVNIGEPAEIPPVKPRQPAPAFTTWQP